MLLFFGYPVVPNVMMAFQDYTTRTIYTGETPGVGFRNYIAVVSSSVFEQAMFNTVLFTLASVAGQFAIGLAIAVFFHRHFPLSGLLRSLLLLPWPIPLIVSGAVWRWILDHDHGANCGVDGVDLHDGQTSAPPGVFARCERTSDDVLDQAADGRARRP